MGFTFSRRRRETRLTWPLIFASLLLVFDQLTKLLIKTNFAYGQSQPVIQNILHITYIRNPGAAFGILKDHRWIFITFTSIVIILGIILLLMNVIKPKLLVWASCLILSGGIGNMIDRIFVGYVVDFIDVRMINFYVFNIADCCVVIGSAMVILYFIIDMWNDRARSKKAKHTK